MNSDIAHAAATTPEQGQRFALNHALNAYAAHCGTIRQRLRAGDRVGALRLHVRLSADVAAAAGEDFDLRVVSL